MAFLGSDREGRGGNGCTEKSLASFGEIDREDGYIYRVNGAGLFVDYCTRKECGGFYRANLCHSSACVRSSSVNSGEKEGLKFRFTAIFFLQPTR